MATSSMLIDPSSQRLEKSGLTLNLISPAATENQLGGTISVGQRHPHILDNRTRLRMDVRTSFSTRSRWLMVNPARQKSPNHCHLQSVNKVLPSTHINVMRLKKQKFIRMMPGSGDNGDVMQTKNSNQIPKACPKKSLSQEPIHSSIQHVTAPEDSERIPVAFVRVLLQKTSLHGCDVDALLQRYSLTSVDLQRNDVTVSAEEFALLQEDAIREIGDETLGYGPSPLRPGTWSMICRGVIDCGKLGHALSRMFKYYSLFDGHLRSHLSIEGSDAVIEISPPTSTFNYELFAYEQVLSVTHRFASWLIDEAIPLSFLSFRHDPPAHSMDYSTHYKCPTVSFSQLRCEMRFPRRLLDASVKQNERTLQPLFENTGLELLAAARDDYTWTSQLKKLVMHDLTAVPDFETMADHLGIHPQTLRRRLAAEGITYKDIKDNARRQAATYFVTQQSMSIEEMAYRSGFSEASAFIRAFKRWTGMTPTAYAYARHSNVAPANTHDLKPLRAGPSYEY